jgi:NADPH-dependent 2,4-dienoyl-CoA reductase/sulfur reductase-like enzyme
MLRRVVVVGASLAGLRAVEALRRQDYAGEVVWLGAEVHPPYDRPPLSKQLLRGEWSAERAFLRRDTDYDELSVDLRLGVRATALDAANKRITLGDGSTLDYDGIVIATGASARRLPFGQGLSGVHVLRTLDDAIAICAALQARPRVCVVGAGFIGLEVAASCRLLGLDVCAIEPLPLPLANKVGTRMAQLIAALHIERGVDLRCGTSVVDLHGDGHVETVRLSDGSTIQADLVVVGIGVQPSIQWLEGSGLALGDGVLCDATCAASAPDVVAAGDVARWHNPLFGESMRVEHWSNAGEMATHAVKRLLGGPEFIEPFKPVPYFWSDQYDLKIQFAGSVRPDDQIAIVEGTQQDRKLVALYGREGRVTGVIALNRPAQLVRYRRLLADGMSWEAGLAQTQAQPKA